MESERKVELPRGLISWNHALILDERNSILKGAWFFTTKEVDDLFSDQEIVAQNAVEYARNKRKRDDYLKGIENRTKLWEREPEKVVAIMLEQLQEKFKKPRTKKLLRKKQYLRMNNDLLRETMSVLSTRALETRDDERGSFSINSLAEELNPVQPGNSVRPLREWVIPTLSYAGYVEGYDEEREYRNQRYKLKISDDGLLRYLEYLTRCEQESADSDSDLRRYRDKKWEQRGAYD